MSTEHRRPGFHLTPRRNWMNDPNGPFWLDGLYHLYFQHNPAGLDWGDMSWGHATSPDLVTWTEHPVAILCDPTEQIFSGSVVVDHDNTSGFGDGRTPPLVAIYTSAYSSGRQAQSLAVSVDGGRSWRKHSGNPVLDRGSNEFRDPKVVRLADRDGRERWVMLAVEAVERQVVIYSSDDLLTWTFESALGPFGPDGVVWECPDLLRLAVGGEPGRRVWVLLLSTNPPDLSAQSSTVYLVGDFDGHVFTPLDTARWPVLDHGTDFYAATSFANLPDGRPVVIAWAGNWQYAALTPTSPWRGMMSLPRELSLVSDGGDIRLRQEVPAGVLAVLRRDDWSHGPAPLQHPVRLPAGRRYLLELECEMGGADVVGIDLLVGHGTRTRVRYDAGKGELSVDRTNSGEVGFHPEFPSISRSPAPLRSGRINLQVVVDASVVEVFADDGAVSITTQVFADEDALDTVVVAEAGAPVVTVRYHSLGGPAR